MKKYLKKILTILSRAIYLIIPEEYKPAKKKSLLQNKLDEELTEETFNHFKEEFKKSLLFDDIWKIRKYAIEEAKSIEKTDNENYTYLEFHIGNFVLHTLPCIYTYKYPPLILDYNHCIISIILNLLWCFISTKGTMDLSDIYVKLDKKTYYKLYLISITSGICVPIFYRNYIL